MYVNPGNIYLQGNQLLQFLDKEYTELSHAIVS